MTVKKLALPALALLSVVAAALPNGTAGQRRYERIAILGDSMTWIGGDSCQNDRGWTHTFRELYGPAEIDIYARSGATWTDSPCTKGDTTQYSEVITDENVISNQMRCLIGRAERHEVTAPDLVIIYAGANDAWFSSRRPGIFDATARTSLDSCVRSVCGSLTAAFPETRIILVTPVEMTKVTEAKIRKVSDIIEKSGRSSGAVTLRADRDVEIRRSQELKRLTNTSDGVHTTPAGARLIGEYVYRGICRPEASPRPTTDQKR